MGFVFKIIRGCRSQEGCIRCILPQPFHTQSNPNINQFSPRKSVPNCTASRFCTCVCVCVVFSFFHTYPAFKDVVKKKMTLFLFYFCRGFGNVTAACNCDFDRSSRLVDPSNVNGRSMRWCSAQRAGACVHACLSCLPRRASVSEWRWFNNPKADVPPFFFCHSACLSVCVFLLSVCLLLLICSTCRLDVFFSCLMFVYSSWNAGLIVLCLLCWSGEYSDACAGSLMLLLFVVFPVLVIVIVAVCICIQFMLSSPDDRVPSISVLDVSFAYRNDRDPLFQVGPWKPPGFR